MAKNVSPTEFKVMLGAFWDATGVVDTQSKRISSVLASLYTALQRVADDWESPAANTLTKDLLLEFKADADNVDDLLAEIVRRMRQTYKNYEDVERRAEQNLENLEIPQ